VLLLLAGAFVLATLPRGAGAVRVGGLSLLWWYALVAAPLAAAGATAAVLRGGPPSVSRDSPSDPPT